MNPNSVLECHKVCFFIVAHIEFRLILVHLKSVKIRETIPHDWENIQIQI